jgi:hypothetical protein
LLIWRQFPQNLKKNPPHNYVEAVPAESQKRIHVMIAFVEAVPAESQREYVCGFPMWKQFPQNLKKNLPHNYVETVPVESQKKSAPKLCNYVEAVPT